MGLDREELLAPSLTSTAGLLRKANRAPSLVSPLFWCLSGSQVLQLQRVRLTCGLP